MDRPSKEIQSLSICHKLFYFIMKTLNAHATRHVTLGDSSHSESEASKCCGPQPESECESIILIEEADFDARKSSNTPEKARNIDVDVSVEKWPTKKTVSIKDEVEVIDLGKKRLRRVSFEKQMSSMKKGDNVELRPLKSILRVGSMQNK